MRDMHTAKSHKLGYQKRLQEDKESIDLINEYLTRKDQDQIDRD